MLQKNMKDITNVLLGEDLMLISPGSYLQLVKMVNINTIYKNILKTNVLTHNTYNMEYYNDIHNKTTV